MADPKDSYFEFINEKDYLVVVKRSQVIAITQNYPDSLDIPKANKDTYRCSVLVETTESQTKIYRSSEKFKKLKSRLYQRPFSGV